MSMLRDAIAGLKNAVYGKESAGEAEVGIIDRLGYTAIDGDDAFMSGGLGEPGMEYSLIIFERLGIR